MTDDIEARVARVLAEHYADNCCGMDCECGWVYAGWDEYAAHVAAVLNAEGLLADHTYCNERVDRADERTDAAREALARIEALADQWDAEANDYSANKEPDPTNYDRGADDQLDTCRRALRAALRGDGEATT